MDLFVVWCQANLAVLGHRLLLFYPTLGPGAPLEQDMRKYTRTPTLRLWYFPDLWRLPNLGNLPEFQPASFERGVGGSEVSHSRHHRENSRALRPSNQLLYSSRAKHLRRATAPSHDSSAPSSARPPLGCPTCSSPRSTPLHRTQTQSWCSSTWSGSSLPVPRASALFRVCAGDGISSQPNAYLTVQ